MAEVRSEKILWFAKAALAWGGAGSLCWLLDRLSLPVAWMIGAVVFAGGLNLAGYRIPTLPKAHTIGLAVISGAVGLSFTPEALAMVGQMLPVMLLAAALSLGCTLLAAVFLMRAARVGYLPACIALLTIGPVESSLMAQRYHLDPTPIIFSQLLRFIAVVLLLPPLLFALNGPGSAAPSFAAASPTLIGTLTLCAVTAAGARLALLVRLPNAWFLGPAVCAMTVQLLGLPVTVPPGAVLALAQMMMGLWLGGVIDRAFFRHSGRYTAAAGLSTLALLVVSAGLGGLIAQLADVSWMVGMMAAAPGASTEMALTAKSLGLGVATVVGFHAVRILLIYFLAPAFIAGIARFVKTGSP